MSETEGYRTIAEVPAEAGLAVAMVVHRDTVYVATTKRVYRLVGDDLVAMRFVLEKGDSQLGPNPFWPATPSSSAMKPPV